MNRLKYVHRFPKANLSTQDEHQPKVISKTLALFNKQKRWQSHKSGGLYLKTLFCLVSDKTEIFWHLRASQKSMKNIWFFIKILRYQKLKYWLNEAKWMKIKLVELRDNWLKHTCTKLVFAQAKDVDQTFVKLSNKQSIKLFESSGGKKTKRKLMESCEMH